MKRIFVLLAVGAFVGFSVGIFFDYHRPLEFRMRAVGTEENTASVSRGALEKINSEQSDRFYLVTKVIDGDTLILNYLDKTETVRLIGVDTPETVDPRKPIQCFGSEASSFVKKLLEGKQVRIETDTSQGERDRYGRLLVYVFYNGENVNEKIITEGYGQEYTYHIPYKYRAEFKSAETSARTGKRGLWADSACDSVSNAKREESPPQPKAGAGSYSGSGDYVCTGNTYNCSNFNTREEAFRVFMICGGSENDVHMLDQDGDGIPCENLP